ncbi:MAG: DEAD/DEAH box helicase [Bacillota bacterium]
MSNEELVTFRNYVLDHFQIQAIRELMSGKSVLVSAPTGVGKTLIADYLIDQARRKGERIIYTAPIKALSNQKYKEFKAWHGGGHVGIITGDIVINPDAPVCIMTTEIFRNILHQDLKRLDGVTHVIFDEIHYLSDEERGTVWEESIIFMPGHMRLLGLSATIPNAQELADWIREIKKHEVAVIRKWKRAVPLRHYLFEKRLGRTDLKSVAEYKTRKEHEAGKENRYRLQYESSTHLDLLRFLGTGYLPCLYFVFSRKLCEDMAYELSLQKDYLSPAEKDEVERAVDGMIDDYGLSDIKIVHYLKGLLLKGIAYHHAGLLPGAKEIVEYLFARNLVRVLYATETFAVGINYPVRTVCFDSPMKFDGVSLRTLKTLEYFQMAGRAGRRGIDEVGYVYMLADLNRFKSNEYPSTRQEDIERLESQFGLSYNAVLSLKRNYSNPEIAVILNLNFATFQARLLSRGYHEKYAAIKEAIDAQTKEFCPDFTEANCPVYYDKQKLRLKKKQRRLNRLKSGLARDELRAEIEELRRGLGKMRLKRCDAALLKKCRRAWSKRNELRAVAEEYEDIIRNIKTENRFTSDLEMKEEILRRLDYLAGDKLLPRGEFAAQIYAQELLLTEAYFTGLFHEWDEDQINAFIVSVDYEPRRGERIPRALPFNYHDVRRIIHHLMVYGVSEDDVRFYPSLSPLAYKWSRGCSFTELIRERGDLQEGDIILAFRRGIDLLRQIRAACAGDQVVTAKICSCIKKMDRDLVEVKL